LCFDDVSPIAHGLATRRRELEGEVERLRNDHLRAADHVRRSELTVSVDRELDHLTAAVRRHHEARFRIDRVRGGRGSEGAHRNARERKGEADTPR
jgi:hypothetical protein